MHRRNPYDGNAESTRPPDAEQMPRFVQPIGVDIGPQQCEFDQIVLRAATADALVFPRERRKRLDCVGKLPAFKRRETARQDGKIRARRVTPFSRQRLYLVGTGIDRGLVSDDGLRQDNVQIREPAAWLWQGAVLIVVQIAPGSGV